MSRWLIIFGVVLIAAGLLWPLLQKLGLGVARGHCHRAQKLPLSLILPDRHIADHQRRPLADPVAVQPVSDDDGSGETHSRNQG
jgi:hypothetical protein